MTRAPWRSADVTDVILGRSSRPSLPAIAASMGLQLGTDLSAFGIRADEVYLIVHVGEHTIPQLLIWPMKLGEPWQH